MANQPANIKNSAAKTPPPAKTLPGNIGVKDPTAPATAVNITELAQGGVNVLHMPLTAAEPVSSVGGPPQRALTLSGLVKRGLAELTPSPGTAKAYVISDQGHVLAGLLWPDVAAPPARKAPAARKPRPRKAPVASKTDEATEADTSAEAGAAAE